MDRHRRQEHARTHRTAPVTRCRREPVVPTAAATGPRRHDRRSPRARFGGSHDYEYSLNLCKSGRMLLLRGGDTLTPRAWERLETVFRTDDPTDELSAAWGIKEQLRRLLATDTLAQAWEERMRMGYFTQIANMPEATKLYDTVVAWWDAIEVLIVTGATTARVEAANTGIKNIKRTGRGFRNAENYRTRILLTSAARTVA
ncbi:ISL3 family transposase [Brachybacterium sp. AOP35-5H-19]|uniref:ISL3 family transposase n=1 Tax=Brachybacterium sp. AOP35-5H-19 TaxID=3457685 RepID=UPI004033CE5F